MIRWILVAAAFANVAAAADRIEIAVCEEADVPVRALATAESVVDRTFHRAGIWVAWRSCASVAGSVAPRVTIRIRLAPQAVDTKAPVWTSGRAYRVAGRQDYAEVFFDVIRAYAGSSGLNAGDVLGNSILHEIGHLMKVPGAERGIMAEIFGWQERDRVARAQVQFSRAETSMIVDELHRRTRDIRASIAEIH